jgi:hypothetical protein
MEETGAISSGAVRDERHQGVTERFVAPVGWPRIAIVVALIAGVRRGINFELRWREVARARR